MNSDSTPDILYHYTTQQGLLGIITNSCLWATHILYLNDQKEYWHAFDVTRKVIQDKLKTSIGESQKKRLDSIDRELGTHQSADIFVASLSEDGDSLSQWRAYGANGNGFSIGFSREKLNNLALKVGWRLGPCSYHLESQINEVLLPINSDVQARYSTKSVTTLEGNPDCIYIMSSKYDDFTKEVLEFTPFLKHSAFHEEKEWRLVFNKDNHDLVCHRARQSLLIPYCEFSLLMKETLDCISEIIVGPTAHIDLSEKSLKSFLESKYLYAVETKQSSIPYRNL